MEIYIYIAKDFEGHIFENRTGSQTFQRNICLLIHLLWLYVRKNECVYMCLSRGAGMVYG